MNLNLFCVSEEELAAEVAALPPADRATLDALPAPADRPVWGAAKPVLAKKHDARLDAYTGSFPRKRHYHRCPECRVRGSNGSNCYKSRCTLPVLLSGRCSWCRMAVK